MQHVYPSDKWEFCKTSQKVQDTLPRAAWAQFTSLVSVVIESFVAAFSTLRVHL